MMKKLCVMITVLILLTSGLLFANGDQEGKAKKMRIGVGVSQDHFQYKSLLEMEKYIEEATSGTVQVDIFHSGQLGSNEQVLEAIKTGGAEMVTLDPSVLGNSIPEFNLFSIPFLFPNQKAADAISQDSEVIDELFSKLESTGYKGLGFGGFGFRQISNNVRSISSMEDLVGLKLRTMNNPLHLDVFRSLGANPTPMAFNELFSALQQGVVDGQENPLMNIYNAKFQEVQKYLTLDSHVYAYVVLVTGVDWFNSLTPEEQVIVKEGARIATIKMNDYVKSEDAKALNLLKDAGMIVNMPSPEFLKEIKIKCQPVVTDFVKGLNYDLYLKLVEEIDNTQS